MPGSPVPLLETGWGTIPNERSAEIGRRAIALAEEAGDDRGAGWAHVLMILIELQLGNDRAAEEHGERALALLEPLGESAELAEAIHRIGWQGWRRGDDASETLRRAVDMARRVDAPVVLAGATHTLALQLSQNGDTADALAMIEVAFELAKQVDDQLNLLRIYTNYTSLLTTDVVDLPRARELAREGLEVSRRAGATGFVAWQLENEGSVYCEMGDLQRSEETLREALVSAQVVGDGPLIGFIHQDLARVLLEEGRIDEGTVQLERSDDILLGRTEAQAKSRGTRLHAIVASARGDDDAALAHLRRGIGQAFAAGVNADAWSFLDLFSLLAARGGTDEIASVVGDLDRHGTSPSIRAVVELGHGLIAEQSGDRVRLVTQSADTLGERGVRVQHGRVLLALARALHDAGEDSTQVLDRARTIFRECGAKLYLPAAEAALGGRAARERTQ